MGKRAVRRQPEKSRRLSPASIPLVPRNELQASILHSLQNEDQVFVIGAAGTGKTYLATSYAAIELGARNFDRIILVRPAVAAGEEHGFLPGDIKEKMDPWVRPFIDVLEERMSKTGAQQALQDGRIEICPIAYMRGRSIDNALILVDEAQNCTYEQLKMILTRAGENSKVFVFGDHTQSDLGHKSGLPAFAEMAEDGGVSVFRFGPEHVVRSKICQFWTEQTTVWESRR
jgi:phosphate starvation-inducible PhoH-like protein